MNKDRYLVIIWFHDHWSVSYTGDDYEDAFDVSEKVPLHMTPLIVDTVDWRVMGTRQL